MSSIDHEHQPGQITCPRCEPHVHTPDPQGVCTICGETVGIAMSHKSTLRKQIIAEKGHDPYQIERDETVSERIERIKANVARQNPDSTWLGTENGDFLWMIQMIEGQSSDT